jgi:intracellular sulfur oxidation DsrE/DsrF family protein
MNTRRARMVSLALLIATGSSLAGAQALLPPVVPGYGEVIPVENAAEKPDPTVDYKVVLNATKGGPTADAPPVFLDKAAKVANLLAQSGVPAEHRHIVVILQGAATTAVLNEKGLKARGLARNPSTDLIAKLNKAGVSVRVCGQALAVAKIARDEVMPGVQVDLSALTTVAALQGRGYSLLVD